MKVEEVLNGLVIPGERMHLSFYHRGTGTGKDPEAVALCAGQTKSAQQYDPCCCHCSGLEQRASYYFQNTSKYRITTQGGGGGSLAKTVDRLLKTTLRHEWAYSNGVIPRPLRKMI